MTRKEFMTRLKGELKVLKNEFVIPGNLETAIVATAMELVEDVFSEMDVIESDHAKLKKEIDNGMATERDRRENGRAGLRGGLEV